MFFFLTLTIASNDKEFVVVAEFVNGNVGVCRDNLLLGRKLGALLEFEIADCARQSKVAVHTAKIDEATGSSDACLFG